MTINVDVALSIRKIKSHNVFNAISVSFFSPKKPVCVADAGAGEEIDA